MNIKIFMMAMEKTFSNMMENESAACVSAAIFSIFIFPFASILILTLFLYYVYNDVGYSKKEFCDDFSEIWPAFASVSLFCLSNIGASFYWFFTNNIISIFALNANYLPFFVFNTFSAIIFVVLFIFLFFINFFVKQFKENYKECKKESEQ